MIRSSLWLRRALTVIGVVAVLAIGVGSIRAAAAWTAASAPLTVATVSVKALEASLEVERARSAALETRLDALDQRSRDLAAALADAQARVVVDSGDADAIAEQMAEASAKLARVEAAIAKAERSLKATQAAARRQAAAVAAAASSTSSSREDRHDDEDEDDHPEDDDD